MYLGIDLGTSNSAIATLNDGSPKVFKTPEGTDIMPSVIYRDRRGNQTIGVRAYDQAALSPENTVSKFKRLLGTDTALRFASTGQAITPEEASAEVLRALVGYALVEAGTSTVTGAVVTIPAAFNQMQSEATLSAAQAAGLDRVALLQEPVAAAMAAMANSRNRSGLFLVYDLGGGTFDLALVQAIDGSVSVLAHEGMNMLGGYNFDRMIVDNVVRRWLREHFALPENFSADKRYQRVIRAATRAAEIAKIDLSTRETTSINASDEIVRLEDMQGEPIYIDVPLDRRTLDGLVEESMTQSIDLCRKIIDDNGYRHEDIERIVLIGGPTKMPTVRRRVQDELGIAVEDIARVEPMTSVAIGAAIYCEGRDWRDGGSTAKVSRTAVKSRGAVSVSYEYEARTANTRARLTIRRDIGPAEASVQVDSQLGWTSGRRSLAEPVELHLELPDRGPNRFKAMVFDADGRPVLEASREIVIDRLLASTNGVPATQTIAVKLRGDHDRDTLEPIVHKGTILPADGIHRCLVAETLRAGEPGRFRVELFQLADEDVKDPECNLCIGEFSIDGSDLPEGMTLRKGDEVLIHWSMSEGQIISPEIEVPSVGQRFDGFYDRQAGAQCFDGAEGAGLTEEILEGAEQDVAKAEAAVPSLASGEVARLRKQLEQQREAAQGTIEADARRTITEEVRLIRQKVARICLQPDARQQVLRRRLDDEVRWYDKNVRFGASAEDNERVDALARNARGGIEEGDSRSLDLAERQIEEIDDLYWRAGLPQPAFCAHLWRFVRQNRHLARDRTLFDKIVADGDQALAAGDTADLRNAIFRAWDNQIATTARQHIGERASLMRG